MNRLLSLFISAFCVSMPLFAGEWTVEIHYRSDADYTDQPAMFYDPKSETAVPLVVALHSWSGDYTQPLHQPIEAWCIKNGWAYIHPDFRGTNRKPSATGSKLVVQDIASAVEYAKKNAKVDPTSIYLVGTSGGGMASLLMAGKHPKIWAGVSAWVPIYDLAAWHGETKTRGLRYPAEIEASCGGAPGDSEKVDGEYRTRSPKNYLENARGVRIHLNVGIRDGHDGSVPVSHSLNAFNVLAHPKDRLSPTQMQFIESKAEIPKELPKAVRDESYEEKQPLFRRSSHNVTLTIFDGAHELIPNAAIAWIQELEKQKAGKTGK